MTTADPEQVWRYLADFTTTNEWDPRANHTRLVSGDGDVGSSYETDVSFLGRTTRMTYTVTALEPHRRIEWVGENKAVRAHDVIDVRPVRTGAVVVDYTSSYDYKRAPAVLDRLMSLPLNRLCNEAQHGLRATLTRGAAA